MIDLQNLQVGQVWQSLPLVARLTVLKNVMPGAFARPQVLPMLRSYLHWCPALLP